MPSFDAESGVREDLIRLLNDADEKRYPNTPFARNVRFSMQLSSFTDVFRKLVASLKETGDLDKFRKAVAVRTSVCHIRSVVGGSTDYRDSSQADGRPAGDDWQTQLLRIAELVEKPPTALELVEEFLKRPILGSHDALVSP